MKQNVNVLAWTWSEKSYPVWSKFFLCRSDARGENPSVLYELPAKEFTTAGNVNYGGPTVWWPAITLFDVSWSHQKAVVVLNRKTDSILFVDLSTGACEPHCWRSPYPQDLSCVRPETLELIDGGNRILASATMDLVGVFGFDGSQRTTNTWSVPRHWFFPAPMWNEEQKVIALLFGQADIWVFDADFNLIEKVDVGPLQELWTKNMRKQQKTDHKYAWVMERRWNPQKPSPIEFHLKGRTIERGRIDPKDAASIW